MRRTFSPIGVGLVLLAASACAGEPARATPAPVPEPTLEVTAVAAQPEATVVVSPTAQATVEPEALETLSFDAPDVQSIGELSFGVGRAIDAAPHQVGLAVLDLQWNIAYAGGDDEKFALASVSKLAIALGVLRRAELEGRELTPGEGEQLRQMLSESRNGPAVELWAELGADAVSEALSEYGVTGFWMPSDDQWGDMTASATSVATLMRLFVADGSPLREDDRTLVLSLLQGVVAGQRWGVSAGVDLSDGAGTVLAIKNGWYPQDQVWRVNSAGALTVRGETGYVVVVLSDGASDFPRGVRVVEEIAAAVNGALYPEELLVALPQFVPVVEGEMGEVAEVGEAIADEPVDDLSTEETSPAQFVVLETSEDVLVPSVGSLTSETLEDSLAIWFEVPESEVDALLDAYLGSMRGLGWTELSGPPHLLLSKHHEGRFVAAKLVPGAGRGLQVIEFRIAPIPMSAVGAAALD